MDLTERFPLGGRISLKELDENPYPAYRRLHAEEPVSWCTATGMYLVSRHYDVRTVLLDTENYIAGTEHSLILDTFGEHMLTTEGAQHDGYKKPLLPSFRPLAVKERLETSISAHVDNLIAGFKSRGEADLRSVFASRLPILSMLSLFGLPEDDEYLLRGWYDAFEKALSNFTWDDAVRAEARSKVAEFHDYLQLQLNAKRAAPDDSLFSQMLACNEPAPLSDEEIRRNASIIFFGGISTVEALILNSLYVLTEHQDIMQRLQKQPRDFPTFLDEVVRWSGPVQSATRHVTNPVELHGIEFQPGDAVNCMLAAANHDPEVFEEPERFDMDRPNLRHHLGFAVGAHHCLGSHLAKLEAGIALQGLLTSLPKLRCSPDSQPGISGHEFRLPPELLLSWTLPG